MATMLVWLSDRNIVQAYHFEASGKSAIHYTRANVWKDKSVAYWFSV